MASLRWVALASLVVIGCGGSVINGSSGSGGSGPGTNTGGNAGTGGGPSGSGGSPGGGGASCEAAADAIVANLGGAGATSITVAVRLAAPTLEIQGYRAFTGLNKQVDEAAARDQAQTDTGFTFGCSPAKSVSGSTPTDEFVFSEPASLAQCACCGDGWLAAVSARSGLTVFGTALSVGGVAQNSKPYPASWKPASDLVQGCPAPIKMPPARGFDFIAIDKQGAVLDAASVQSAVSAVWKTAMPLALSRNEKVFDAVVLRYVGSFYDNSAPEYVVLVNTYRAD